MPHFIKGRRVTKAEKKQTIHGIESAETVKRRRRGLRALNLNYHQWIRFFSLASVLLMGMITLTVILALNHYKAYPGNVERDSISSPGRGSDFIIVSWDEAHSADVYKVWCKERDLVIEDMEKAAAEEDANNGDAVKQESGSKEDSANRILPDETWTEIETTVPEATFEGLKEGTSYSFIVRADNAKNEGEPTRIRNFKTKSTQKIKVDKVITKFSFSDPFKPDASAETDLEYESSDPEVADVDPETNEIVIKGSGDTEITIRAKTTREFEGASKVVKLKVIDSDPVNAGGASANIIYNLDSDNCELIKTVEGADGSTVPQGIGYTGDKYMIMYGMGNPNRVISFDVDGEGKEVSVPTVSMGHPNGFTYADENGLCYVAKGWTSKAYTYEPASDSYGSVNLSYGFSGIGYDRKEKLLYTCSRTAMVAYDISDGYSVKMRTGVVSHSGYTYTQDCGGHAGILMRCLSGSDKHGTNYIDLYDMKNGRYLGTISCDLSEVESCIVDKDGFLEILANNSSNTDYIWKTDLNIETLGESL